MRLRRTVTERIDERPRLKASIGQVHRDMLTPEQSAAREAKIAEHRVRVAADLARLDEERRRWA